MALKSISTYPQDGSIYVTLFEELVPFEQSFIKSITFGVFEVPNHIPVFKSANPNDCINFAQSVYEIKSWRNNLMFDNYFIAEGEKQEPSAYKIYNNSHDLVG